VDQSQLLADDGRNLKSLNLLTGEIRNQINSIWDSFLVRRHLQSPGGHRADHLSALHAAARRDPGVGGTQGRAHGCKPIERCHLPRRATDAKGTPYQNLRWSKFKHFEAREMYEVVSDHVFPFLRTLGGDDSTYAHHMKDARFTIPKASLLQRWST
jgi:type I restriction enzyme M protein